jgi:CYTH domain-containing protein
LRLQVRSTLDLRQVRIPIPVSITRRFLLAPSLARLLEKERGGRPITEGYFPDQSDRSLYVRVEEGTGTLILVSHGPLGPVETPADLPHGHAEALLGLAAGGVEYRRVDLSVGAHDASVSRIMAPGPLDLITVAFEQEEQAREFEPLPWFGPEVTNEPGYQTRSLALAGLPAMGEVDLTSAALDSLLDVLDDGSASLQRLVEPLVPATPPLAADVEEDTADLGIEDSVIRELARSLRPQPR